MIDCGGTKRYIFDTLKELNISASDLDVLLLTHGHNDHIALIKNFKDVPILAAFEYQDYDIHQISTHCEFQLGEFKITTLPLSHDYKPTIGFKIEAGTETLVYITDTGYVNSKLFPIISNADYYIFESNHDPLMLMNTKRDLGTKRRILSSDGHLCNKEAANILSQLIGEKTKEIFLAHISMDANDYNLPKEVLHEVLVEMGIPHQNIRIEALKQFELMLGGQRSKE